MAGGKGRHPSGLRAGSAAHRQLERIEALDETLSLALEFLERAQERIHQDIAPVLAEALRPRLAALTGGRYVEAAVDPGTLEVTVRSRGGRWRKARLLSHGTAEQVYLLLRAALAQHLARPGEACPLILDDPTAQWDPERTAACLRLLHEISRERQVIVFSQEADVLAWAHANLREPGERIERLEVVPT